MTVWPNKSPEPTAVGAVSSAVAVHAASRSGLEWQESMWNRLNWEKQMMSDASRLVHPGVVA